MQRSVLFAICLVQGGFTMAQHQADKWYFGMVGDGLDFHDGGCEPTVLNDGNMLGFEGVATISDPITGDLLFYTNSVEILNRTHQTMPNGYLQDSTLLTDQNTISQVLIVRRPLSNSIHYVFTNQIQEGFFRHGMRMAQVDMTLDSGLGDVTFKDSIIYAGTVSEKVTAVMHANGNDIWVIGHEYSGDRFFAFLVDSSGIQYPPVFSNVGKSYVSGSVDCIGEIKGSPDGTLLAVTTYEHPDIELFAFNDLTDVISPPIVINAPELDPWGNMSGWYGVSFSPDNTKLYAGRRNYDDGSPSIIQVDVSSGDSLTINASKDTVSTLTDVWSVQLAPNGKIYTCRSGNYLGAINNPNASGAACDFDPQAIDLGHAPGGFDGVWGFNNNIPVFPHPCITMDGPFDQQPEPIGIHPLPATDQATLALNDVPEGPCEVQLINAQGALTKVFPVNARENAVELDLTSVDEGVYLVRILSRNFVSAGSRLVVSR